MLSVPLKITRMTETGPADDPIETALREAVQDGMPAAIADLAALVRIPSVSWDGFDPAHVEASARAVAALFEATGVFDSVRVSRAPIGDSGHKGQPAVLAVRAAPPGRPTIMLYAHHDVQPPGRAEDWESAPFEPTVRGDRLFGRGASDDKAGVMAHVAAIRAVVEATGAAPDLGIVAFIEGEEEFGSRSFRGFLEQHRKDLAADAIVVADSGNWSIHEPALTVGLRGNVTFRLTVATLDHALHSGMYGGAVPDAMLAMTRLLATLHESDGSVAVRGLTSGGDWAPEYAEERLREETGLLDSVTPIGRGSILGRIWSQPAITVTGIDAPSIVDASNTLLPSVTAKVSVRVAPGQSAQDAYSAIEAHLLEHAPFGARVELDGVDLGEPFLVDTEGWAVGEAMAALEDAWGAPAVQMGVGGSIPFISDLVARFPDAQILITGVEDPDSRAHSPNESLHLGVFRKAVLAEALLLSRLSRRE